jgi:nucleotide-binding universal stress UspA family protein
MTPLTTSSGVSSNRLRYVFGLSAPDRLVYVRSFPTWIRIASDAWAYSTVDAIGSNVEATMNTIVVGYDGSDPADRALERAAGLAKAFSARLVVTSVAPAVMGRGVGPADPADPPSEHRRQLRVAESRLQDRGLEVEYDLALAKPAEHIVSLADERAADLIVMGTRRLHLVERLLGVSVSDAVQHKAHCDVLVVH